MQEDREPSLYNLSKEDNNFVEEARRKVGTMILYDCAFNLTGSHIVPYLERVVWCARIFRLFATGI